MEFFMLLIWQRQPFVLNIANESLLVYEAETSPWALNVCHLHRLALFLHRYDQRRQLFKFSSLIWLLPPDRLRFFLFLPPLIIFICFYIFVVRVKWEGKQNFWHFLAIYPVTAMFHESYLFPIHDCLLNLITVLTYTHIKFKFPLAVKQ